MRFLYSFFGVSVLRSDYLLLNRFLSLSFFSIYFPLDGCTPTLEDNYCYTVGTNIKISHHPYLYPKESVNLIIASESAEFTSERELYDGDVPTPLEAEVVLILKGVEPRLMEPEEIIILEMTIIEFLNDQLLSDSRKNGTAPILIEDAIITYQEIVLSTGNDNSTTGNDNSTTDIATLQADVIISGEYIPPPEVNGFGDIIVETIDEEDEEFVEVLTENAAESNETYFMAVNDVNAITEEAMGTGGGLDIIAFAGYTVAAFVGFAGVLACISFAKRRHRRNIQAREADELRANAILTAQNVHKSNIRRFESVRLSRFSRHSNAVSPTTDDDHTVKSNATQQQQKVNSIGSLHGGSSRSVAFDIEPEHLQPQSASTTL